jgi:hypothetical protein
VPGGGLSPDGCWVACRPGFFLSVRVLSRLYRRLFLKHLRAAFNAGLLEFFGELAGLAKPATFADHLRALRSVEWVVYAKRPFGGPQQGLDYLGRYTHRVAIANNRLIGLADGEVRFRWKDYRHPQRPKIMTLPVAEFIRRFLLHVLPDGFRRIRHFGFLANAHRSAKLAVIRALLGAPEPVRGRRTGRLSRALCPALRALARYLSRLRRTPRRNRHAQAGGPAIPLRQLMTATRVIASRFAPSAPPPCAGGTLLSASTVSVATADLQGRDEISSRVCMGPVPAGSSSIAAAQIIRRRRPPHCWARRSAQLS